MCKPLEVQGGWPGVLGSLSGRSRQDKGPLLPYLYLRPLVMTRDTRRWGAVWAFGM